MRNLIKRLIYNSGCSCGKMDKCPRKIKVGPGGNFWIENHFECMGIQELNTKLGNWFKKKLKKEMNRKEMTREELLDNSKLEALFKEFNFTQFTPSREEIEVMKEKIKEREEELSLFLDRMMNKNKNK